MATGMYQCGPVAQDQWVSEVSLAEMLEATGWQVRCTKVDGGCREVYGTTPDGERVEGYVRPARVTISSRSDVDGSSSARATENSSASAH